MHSLVPARGTRRFTFLEAEGTTAAFLAEVAAEEFSS